MAARAEKKDDLRLLKKLFPLYYSYLLLFPSAAVLTAVSAAAKHILTILILLLRWSDMTARTVLTTYPTG